MKQPLRVVVAHDYATQRGGAERVAINLLRAFPGSRLITSFWSPETTYPDFADFDVQTLWPNRFGPLRQDPRRAFPLLASTFANHEVRDADVVICSSSGWSHRIRSTAPKIVYCHNPARWLYQPNDYFAGLPPAVRERLVRLAGRMRETDRAAANSAARYLVNSSSVAARVHTAYGLDPTIVWPARGVDPKGPQEPVAGLEPGFLLTVSRPRTYKHAEAVCDAVASMPDQRLVVVGKLRARLWPLGITSLQDLNDAQMRWLYANTAGLVAVAHEDFGLTPAEAQAFGTPSVVLRSGGYLDSSVEDETAVFVEEPSVAQVATGIRSLLTREWDRDLIRHHAERFSPSAFAGRMRSVVDDVLTAGDTGGLRSRTHRRAAGS